jgi:hypothetical protein
MIQVRTYFSDIASVARGAATPHFSCLLNSGYHRNTGCCGNAAISAAGS